MASFVTHPLQSQSRNILHLINTHLPKSYLLQIHALLLRDYLIFDIFHCNAMLKAYVQTNSHYETLSFYRHMSSLGVRGNSFSSSFVFKSCTQMSSLVTGKLVHCRIFRDGHQSDSLLLTSLMGLYSSCRELESVRKVFDELPDRDTVSWNMLISSFINNNRTKDALLLFDAMQSPEYESVPDEVTCLLLLQACANLGTVDFGERVHRYIEKNDYGSLLKVSNSLITMYSKCGCVDKAYRVFCDMHDRSVVTWSAMISGLARNGYGREAIDTFNEMIKEGIVPDGQVFTGVLSACSHSGLVDKGMKFLDAMRVDYGLSPNICHYGCVVDLLGRVGLLDRAYHLVTREMSVQPDPTIWRTLLGACRIHQYVELGEHVIEHLIELKAQEAGDYVLLLNIYASVGNWDRVADLRRLMKERGIQTSPGCTTMELKGQIHEFIADDDNHPRKAEIYAMLDEIGQQLKIAGYIANSASELHDLDMEQKDNALSYHSEKLALAFGILATVPGRTLRIANNLRMCVDCHNFIKTLSSVYSRLIIVRDRSRFHHFREGRCSCNDYW
ncbi:hypothetical protein HPP92_015607 [Vanilla planifolia]|uniref:DYW domain-containing protein n=1 Tax=Vanilla planifolia TaxID=51239 RepID=A0A835QHM7_VANPL|nr:hypothetical protein HPP92_015607 [Vanilla planifolia]